MENKYTEGFGDILVVLGLIFLVLRLCNVIDWNWWLVCLPFIIEGGLFILSLILYIAILRLNNR